MRRLQHAVALRRNAPEQSVPGDQAPRLLQTTQEQTITKLFALVLIAARSGKDYVQFCSKGRSHNT